eukprot:CAMPEP_0184499152 /NCGR_PEP_ID=MMETSP0113_2-20130426/40810_1 /TAXON_ID=91329 /ORGANISM="Norrisiella sphaerica, Strain BC52" /LENGTH=279 /DNA_ID=CAMNT_0026886973 /DNA_START=254 /DNA_END=1093 /DNA_ORIENTATION=-
MSSLSDKEASDQAYSCRLKSRVDIWEDETSVCENASSVPEALLNVIPNVELVKMVAEYDAEYCEALPLIDSSFSTNNPDENNKKRKRPRHHGLELLSQLSFEFQMVDCLRFMSFLKENDSLGFGLSPLYQRQNIKEFYSRQNLWLCYNSSITYMPPSIKSLCNLKVLVISHNALAEVPSEIRYFTALEKLDLSYNALERVCPEIQYARELRELDLGHNRLTRLPKAITRLRKLSTLVLSYNELEDLPEGFEALPSLRKLDIVGNKHLQAMQYDDEAGFL